MVERESRGLPIPRSGWITATLSLFVLVPYGSPAAAAISLAYLDGLLRPPLLVRAANLWSLISLSLVDDSNRIDVLVD
ncbi:hypothetical protein E2562_038785 [Oryza meyeriana var. granulata]|uniref:Uncharacterized protein n=1 Tax=Oryza meyeriana var. granulata TaxID=110450 RepID=A0A6G1EUG4_9ORYZ|nr:hypothetical protein E2562_038785 [Oryza meyeriana var. granulata]